MVVIKMNQLHLCGWLYRDGYNLLGFSDAKKNDANVPIYGLTAIVDAISELENIQWVEYEDNGRRDDGYGGMRTIIPNACVRVYATDKKCSLDDAVKSVALYLDGAADVDIGYAGYSEYTITNYFFREFRIGGHDLDVELNRYIGKYVHFIIDQV